MLVEHSVADKLGEALSLGLELSVIDTVGLSVGLNVTLGEGDSDDEVESDGEPVLERHRDAEEERESSGEGVVVVLASLLVE